MGALKLDLIGMAIEKPLLLANNTSVASLLCAVFMENLNIVRSVSENKWNEVILNGDKQLLISDKHHCKKMKNWNSAEKCKIQPIAEEQMLH